MKSMMIQMGHLLCFLVAANETMDVSGLRANQQYQNSKCSTVQEIERLQRNREERRAQQV